MQGTLEGHPVVSMTFDPAVSGLEKSLAFPLLISNATSFLLLRVRDCATRPQNTPFDTSESDIAPRPLPTFRDRRQRRSLATSNGVPTSSGRGWPRRASWSSASSGWCLRGADDARPAVLSSVPAHARAGSALVLVVLILAVPFVVFTARSACACTSGQLRLGVVATRAGDRRPRRPGAGAAERARQGRGRAVVFAVDVSDSITPDQIGVGARRGSATPRGAAAGEPLEHHRVWLASPACGLDAAAAQRQHRSERCARPGRQRRPARPVRSRPRSCC